MSLSSFALCEKNDKYVHAFYTILLKLIDCMDKCDAT